MVADVEARVAVNFNALMPNRRRGRRRSRMGLSRFCSRRPEVTSPNRRRGRRRSRGGYRVFTAGDRRSPLPDGGVGAGHRINDAKLQ